MNKTSIFQYAIFITFFLFRSVYSQLLVIGNNYNCQYIPTKSKQVLHLDETEISQHFQQENIQFLKRTVEQDITTFSGKYYSQGHEVIREISFKNESIFSLLDYTVSNGSKQLDQHSKCIKEHLLSICNDEIAEKINTPKIQYTCTDYEKMCFIPIK